MNNYGFIIVILNLSFLMPYIAMASALRIKLWGGTARDTLLTYLNTKVILFLHIWRATRSPDVIADGVWWLWVDSNHRPRAYESLALTG